MYLKIKKMAICLKIKQDSNVFKDEKDGNMSEDKTRQQCVNMKYTAARAVLF